MGNAFPCYCEPWVKDQCQGLKERAETGINEVTVFKDKQKLTVFLDFSFACQIIAFGYISSETTKLDEIF